MNILSSDYMTYSKVFHSEKIYKLNEDMVRKS